MGWILLLLGIALWWGAHLFKRVMPMQRQSMGDAGRGIVAGVLALSVLLMVLGYRATDATVLWQLPAFAVHINNLLVLVAIFLMSPAPKRGRIASGLRHPMLTGFALWAIAHLLVNGDLPSLVLFGGLFLWSVITPRIINAAEPEWSAPQATGTYGKDVIFLAASVVLMGVIGFIHSWLGPWPFPS